jgi:acyl-coenzyme A synthetase/AMP-(fatty) acid ligase
MIGLLERAAHAAPEQIAVVTPEASTSYGDLLADARRIASGLRERGITRFAVVEGDATWVLRLLGGAALAGAEACQFEPEIQGAELDRHAGALGHAVVVTRRDDLDTECTVVDAVELVGRNTADPGSTSEAQPLLVRTTGTTGEPKAARHDWRVLTRAVEGLKARPDQRWLLAYGTHNFSGIQVMLHVAGSQATLVAPFPRQPRDGLDAMLEHGVNAVSATPTYLRFLLAEARGRDVEVPPLEQVTLGGEAVPADLLDRVRAAFPGARVSQIYGSTETGTLMSVRDGQPGFSADALYSESNPTAAVRIIDGQVWARAKTAMLGYAGDTAADPSRAQLDGWWPTGDLADVVGDRVVFRGRDSDIINVGGVKVHPVPIEHRITGIEGVAAARVFGRANPMTGAIVAAEIVPLERSSDSDQERIRREIKAAVADFPRAWHPRSITFVDSIETRGAKTVRGVEA